MAPIPLALSVHHFITSVGTDAGFAALIGLAILILLYFAQAREASSLREQTYEWAQRVQQLEARIAQLTRQVHAAAVDSTPRPAPAPPLGAAVARAPQTAAAAVPAAAAAGVLAARSGAGARSRATSVQTLSGAFAGAPAGVAAPALSAATKLIPTVAQAVSEPAIAAAVPAPEQPLDLTTLGPAPATVAGGANGHAAVESLPTPPPGPAAVPPSSRAAGSPPPRIQLRPDARGAGATNRRSGLPLRPEPSAARSPVRRIVVGLLVALAVVAAVGVLLIATSSGSSSKTPASTTTASTTRAAARHRRKPPAVGFNPASVTVAVLNGTATNLLAHRVALKLDADGYKQGPVRTAADQTHTTTIVAYMPGDKLAATKVAASLGLGSTSVQPIDPTTQGVACPPGAPCTATVVVTVGSNLTNVQ
jgi:hypothetical protein